MPENKLFIDNIFQGTVKEMQPAIAPIHYIVVTIGSAGDLFPFLALALGLRARGHRVSFLGPT